MSSPLFIVAYTLLTSGESPFRQSISHLLLSWSLFKMSSLASLVRDSMIASMRFIVPHAESAHWPKKHTTHSLVMQWLISGKNNESSEHACSLIVVCVWYLYEDTSHIPLDHLRVPVPARKRLMWRIDVTFVSFFTTHFNCKREMWLTRCSLSKQGTVCSGK